MKTQFFTAELPDRIIRWWRTDGVWECSEKISDAEKIDILARVVCTDMDTPKGVK